MFNPIPALVLKNQFGEESINYLAPGTNFVAAYKSAQLVLTAAQVIALNATPQTLIAAVTGEIIQLVALEMLYTHGTAAFTITASKHLLAEYAGVTTVQPVSFLTTGFLDQTTSKEADAFAVGVGGIGIRGAGLLFTCDDSSMSVGTGSTLSVTAYYNLLK